MALDLGQVVGDKTIQQYTPTNPIDALNAFQQYKTNQMRMGAYQQEQADNAMLRQHLTDPNFNLDDPQSQRALLGTEAGRAVLDWKAKNGDAAYKQLQEQAKAVVGVGSSLLKTPQGPQRLAVWNQAVPLLKAAGIKDEALAGIDPNDDATISAQVASHQAILGGWSGTLTPGAHHFENGNDVASVPETGYYDFDPTHTYVPKAAMHGGNAMVPQGENTTAPAPTNGMAAPPVARTAGGWTPRARNGGDNSDAAVNSKITAASGLIGVGPDDDLRSLPPIKIAQAMTANEGGAGSIAARNNNPANLRNPDGSYKVFPTREAGLAAAADLVSRKMASGQTTIRTLIEGLPVGASGGAQMGGAAALPNGFPPGTIIGHPKESVDDPLPGDPNATGPAYLKSLPADLQPTIQSIVDGRFPITSRMTSPKTIRLFEMANKVDPSVDATTYTRRVATQKAFAPGGKQGVQLISGKTLVDHLYDLAQASDKLGGSSLTPLNTVHNWYLGKTSDPSLTTYNTILTKVADEEPKFLTGSATIPGIAQSRADYDASKGPGARKAAIAATINLMDGRFQKILDAYTTGMNKDADISDLLGRQAAKLDALRQWAANPDAPLPQIGTVQPGSRLGTEAGPVAHSPQKQGGSGGWSIRQVQ